MFLTRLSVQQPVFATMLMVALAVLGLTSYQQLKVDQFPDVEFPLVTVTTLYPGASPETVEREVTKRIEEAVNTVEGVKTIESTSQEGLSNIVVIFHIGNSTQVAAQDIRGKVAAIRGQLPREVEEPIVQRIDPAAMPVISVAVDAPGLSPQAATDLAEKLVKRRLETVSGVGAVNLVGDAKREVQVVVDRARLEAYRVSLLDVVGALRNENVDVPAGSADRGATEAMVRVAARARSAADVAEIPVKTRGASVLRVRDLAQVVDGVEEPKNLAFRDVAPTLAVEVQKQSGANTVALSDAVRRAMTRLEKELPAGVRLSIIRDDSTFIRDSIHDINVTMALGALLTVLVVFVFLNSWRSTVITGLTLPIAVIASFTVMQMFGFTLNTLTLMGLSLAIGMLIDDAIVVRENIVRHMQRGKDHYQAALDGTDEIGLAVMATTFTIVAVFVPVAFMGGMVGQFFYEFGIVVAGAVLFSLFVSFTLDPMLSSRWYDPASEQDRHEGRLGRLLARFNHAFDDLHLRYERTLGWALDRRGLVLGLAAASFVAGLLLIGLFVGGDFMPDYNRGEYQVMFKSSPGATLRETGERSLEMVRRLRSIPEVEYTYTSIGEAGTSYRPVNEGVIYVKLRSTKGQSFSQALRRARQAIEGVPGVTFGLTEAGPFGQKPIQISLRGQDIAELDRLSRELQAGLRRIPGVTDIESSLEKSKPELAVRVNRERAGDLGLTAGPIATTLRAAVAGEVPSVIEDEQGDSHDVRVRLRADQRRFAEDLLQLTVPSERDDANLDKVQVPLREVVRAETGTGPSTVRRKDLQREVRVSANPDGRPLQQLSQEIESFARAELKLPAGYDIVLGGDTQELEDMFASMFRALFLAVIFIYLILASQFGSFTQPLAIMLSLPLSLVGVAVALLLTGDTLNIMSMIGLIMLMGLVTKNAILLVDFANQAQKEGLPQREALIRAGSTRLRPIVMTTLAMIFGMLPLALALGPGAEMRAPMARAVIGGLITSTLLTLIVVPVVYTYLDRLTPASLREWWRRRRGQAAAAPVPEAEQA